MNIIAEAGSNHNGNIERAKELVSIAANTKASSVKFQFIYPEGLYIEKYRDNDQLIENPVFNARKSEVLSPEQWNEVWEFAKTKSIDISASVFCKEGVDLLHSLGASYVKIASTDLSNQNLIGYASEHFNNIIISTGMSTFAEIDETVRFMRVNHPTVNVSLMHCVSQYPCPLEASNMRRLSALRKLYDINVGYSDHTISNTSAAMAVVLGASLFEKHFTCDKNLPGFDHKHALDPQELKKYIEEIKAAECSLSMTPAFMSKGEEISKIRARRGVYAAKDLPVGHQITSDDIKYVRPSTDSNIHNPSLFVGGIVKEAISAYSPLDLQGVISHGESRWKEASSYWNKEMQEKGMSKTTERFDDK